MLESDFELNLSYDNEASIMASFMNDSKPKSAPARPEKKFNDLRFEGDSVTAQRLEKAKPGITMYKLLFHRMFIFLSRKKRKTKKCT
jgi:hypothetical protein